MLSSHRRLGAPPAADLFHTLAFAAKREIASVNLQRTQPDKKKVGGANINHG